MSNKSRLQTNNTNLQALIDKANALPDAGGSGGGSVETCVVNFENYTLSEDVDILCTRYVNGVVQSGIPTVYSDDSHTETAIVKDTSIYLFTDSEISGGVNGYDSTFRTGIKQVFVTGNTTITIG